MRSLMAVGLCVFNDVILESASRYGLAVLDLRVICTEPEDYPALSPIEPSAAGGQKIAAGIDVILKGRDWAQRSCRLYG